MNSWWAQGNRWISPSVVIISLVIGVLVGSIGLGYLGQRERNARLERQIRSLQSRLQSLRRQNQQLQGLVAQLKAPERLHRILEGSQLSPPTEEQIFRVPETRSQISFQQGRGGWAGLPRKEGREGQQLNMFTECLHK